MSTDPTKRYSIVAQVVKAGDWLQEDFAVTMTELVDRYGWASPRQLKWLMSKGLDTRGEFLEYGRHNIDCAVVLEITSLDFMKWCLLSGDSVKIINDDSHG
jgi:hypothetical protein